MHQAICQSRTPPICPCRSCCSMRFFRTRSSLKMILNCQLYLLLNDVSKACKWTLRHQTSQTPSPSTMQSLLIGSLLPHILSRLLPSSTEPSYCPIPTLLHKYSRRPRNRGLVFRSAGLRCVDIRPTSYQFLHLPIWPQSMCVAKCFTLPRPNLP